MNRFGVLSSLVHKQSLIFCRFPICVPASARHRKGGFNRFVVWPDVKPKRHFTDILDIPFLLFPIQASCKDKIGWGSLTRWHRRSGVSWLFSRMNADRSRPPLCFAFTMKYNPSQTSHSLTNSTVL